MQLLSYSAPYRLPNPCDPYHWLFASFCSSGTKRTTIVIIHHTIVRVEPDPMTTIQEGWQRPSGTPPTPTSDSDTTQTRPTGGLPPPVTQPATRWPLPVAHKATGDATTQTRTNVLPTPSFKDIILSETPYQLKRLKTSFTPKSFSTEDTGLGCVWFCRTAVSPRVTLIYLNSFFFISLGIWI